LRNLPKGGALGLFILLVMVLSFSYAGAAVWMQNNAAMDKSEATPPLGTATSFSENALEQALETQSPVFVNMTAAWCISCKVNERLAIDTSFTQALFESHNVIYLKGDWTNQDPVITKFLESYGRNGVPLYVLYGRPDKNGLRPEAVVLPQILTPKIFETLLNTNNP